MAAIELDSVTRRFDEVLALDSLSMTVADGEVFGFLGPNGAGKSTTIDILLDFVRPTSGECRVLGIDPQQDPEAVRQRVGVLPDGYHVYDRLTGRQHVQFAVDSKGASDDPTSLLDRVGIADAADRKAGEYSKGMTQRLVLAMALVGEPDLLVLDEPTTGLDPKGAREMREIIRAEADRGATVFFSSHILEQVEAVCDRVAILRQGQLVAVDSIDNLREGMTGTAETLTVTTAEPVDESVQDALRDIEGVAAVSAAGRELTVSLSANVKMDVLGTLEEWNVDVQDFATEETSLEELFVRYTETEADA
ncbi:ABC transporter ATP-binding protein [Haloarchaeobius amylolyticus]|uniref:ABC transporter ATP-binding protein n=1 Tax=Haloarchaeobius amylolyticus TaxID=1198296 RepID=UPI00226DD52F|nr:ABC transporter ATP-binding protein [Haloarchaeobius amylolyticus]